MVWTFVFLVTMVLLSESSDSTNRCTALVFSNGVCNQLSPEKISEFCAKEKINARTKTWISLAGASFLALIVCIIHWQELNGIDNICLSRSLLLGSCVATIVGIVIILLAVPFDQIIGYALLMSIFVNSLSGLANACCLSNELRTTSDSITSLIASLEKIKETPLVEESREPDAGDAAARRPAATVEAAQQTRTLPWKPVAEGTTPQESPQPPRRSLSS
jgi:hypothetical protein